MFELADGAAGKTGPVCEFLLCPVQKAACGAALAGKQGG